MAASKNPRLRLMHMRDEIRNLEMELGGLNFENYQDSYGLRRTTERAIQIVSEAARALPEDLRRRYPEAPWADILAIGNPCRMNITRSMTRFYGKPPPAICRSCNPSSNACSQSWSLE